MDRLPKPRIFRVRIAGLTIWKCRIFPLGLHSWPGYGYSPKQAFDNWAVESWQNYWD